MNTKLHILRAALCVAGCASWALSGVAADVTIGAAANETFTQVDKITGDNNVSINTGDDQTGTVVLLSDNTYTGTTTLGGGTLEAPVLTESGASSLGSSGTFTFKGGTFKYTGTGNGAFNRAVPFGPNPCTIENEKYLKMSGKWTKSSSPSLTKTGAGKLHFTKKSSKFASVIVNEGTLQLAGSSTTLSGNVTVNEGTLQLAGSSTTLSGDVTVNEGTLLLSGGSSTFSSTIIANGSTYSGDNAISRIQITGGTHSIYQIQVGNKDQSAGEYWADFIMTGGTVTTGTKKGNLQLANKGLAHEVVDISGGTLNIGRYISVGYGDVDKTDIEKHCDITIRDTGSVLMGDSPFRFYVTGSKTYVTLTVKDGGTFKVPVISRNSATVPSPTILFDGGNIIWCDTSTVFTYNGTVLNKAVSVGSKGVTFTGISATQAYTYETTLAATETVAGMTAKGVSFAKGTYTLAVANTYDGPTAIRKDATVIPGANGALPSTSVIKVNRGGTLALTTASPTCAGLVLNGNLDIGDGKMLALGNGEISGTGCITLYSDAKCTTPVTSGTHAIITAPIKNRSALVSFAQTVQNGNIGSFTVTDDGTTATLNLVVDTTTSMPYCEVEGTEASTVTISCVGQVEEHDGKNYIKPGTTAKLSVSSYPAEGPAFAGWRDGTTGEFYWGNNVLVTPTTYTTYTAVFGPAWFWDATAGQVSNGIWTFGASADGKTLTIESVVVAPTDDNGVLNLATPITNVNGDVYATIQVGTNSTAATLFGAATHDQQLALTKLYLPETAQLVGYGAFQYCSNMVGSVTTPIGMTRVCPYAFRDCYSLTSVSLPGVETIELGGFYHCRNLQKVRLSDNLTTIAKHGFNGCTILSSITPMLPDSLTDIGRSAFYELENLTGCLRMENVRRICYSAFKDTQFKEVVMPSITNIGYQAFYGVPATNYVFGLECVHFADEDSNKGYGNLTFYLNKSTVRHFRFPGLAPDMPIRSNTALGSQMFGKKVSLIRSYFMAPGGPIRLGGIRLSAKSARLPLREPLQHLNRVIAT